VAQDSYEGEICGVTGLFGLINNQLLDDCKNAVCGGLNDPDYRTPWLYVIRNGRVEPDTFNGGFIHVWKRGGVCKASLNEVEPN
jgi:hypothetical protein